jgi:hypothetical protein
MRVGYVDEDLAKTKCCAKHGGILGESPYQTQGEVEDVDGHRPRHGLREVLEPLAAPGLAPSGDLKPDKAALAKSKAA